MVVALCNQKGGVGKTTTELNLARAAHLCGLRTLVVDLDPQGNTTSALLGRRPDPNTETLADVLSKRSTAKVGDVVVATGWSGVDVLPSGGDVLADVGAELVMMGPGREHQLETALRAVGRRWDLALLDCPPALDQLTINALTAAELVLIVTTAALWSNDGIARLLSTIDAVREFSKRGRPLTVAGVVVNALDERTRRQRHWLEDLKANSPVPVWLPPIGHHTWIAEAAEAGLGLDEWGTEAARELAGVYNRYLTNLIGDRPVPAGQH